MARVNRIEYKCPDGVTRIFDSKKEIEFIEYCNKLGIKILEYNTDKHKKYELFPTPPKSIRSRGLEKFLLKKGFLYDCSRMRSMEKSEKSFDFHIEIDGVEFLCEIKSDFTNKNDGTLNMSEKSFYTSWALTKALMASKYKKPIIVFIGNDKKIKGFKYTEWKCEYYIPDNMKEGLTGNILSD